MSSLQVSLLIGRPLSVPKRTSGGWRRRRKPRYNIAYSSMMLRRSPRSYSSTTAFMARPRTYKTKQHYIFSAFSGWFIFWEWLKLSKTDFITITIKIHFIMNDRPNQNYWVFGVSPASGILGNRKHDILETRSVSILRCGGEDTYSVGSLKQS
jgi:hypothetical protein